MNNKMNIFLFSAHALLFLLQGSSLQDHDTDEMLLDSSRSIETRWVMLNMEQAHRFPQSPLQSCTSLYKKKTPNNRG